MNAAIWTACSACASGIELLTDREFRHGGVQVETEARKLRKEGETLKQELTKADVLRAEAERDVEEFDNIAQV